MSKLQIQFGKPYQELKYCVTASCFVPSDLPWTELPLYMSWAALAAKSFLVRAWELRSCLQDVLARVPLFLHSKVFGQCAIERLLCDVRLKDNGQWADHAKEGGFCKRNLAEYFYEL